MHKLFRTTPVKLDTSVRRVVEVAGTEHQRTEVEVFLHQLPELWTSVGTKRLNARQVKQITGLVIDTKIAARRGVVTDVLQRTQRLTKTLIAYSDLAGEDTHLPKLPEKKKGR